MVRQKTGNYYLCCPELGRTAWLAARLLPEEDISDRKEYGI